MPRIFVANQNKKYACTQAGTSVYGGRWWPHSAWIDPTEMIACCSPAASVCGNGIKEGTEACDDGGTSNTDSYCNSTCTSVNRVNVIRSWNDTNGDGDDGIWNSSINRSRICIDAFGTGSTVTGVIAGSTWNWYLASYNQNTNVWVGDCTGGTCIPGNTIDNSGGGNTIVTVFCTTGSKGNISGSTALTVSH